MFERYQGITTYRTLVRSAAWLPGLALILCCSLGCSDDTDRDERIEAHYEVLVTTPRDYIEMTREEFIASARRRVEAVDGILAILDEQGIGDEVCEGNCRALERRIFALKTAEPGEVDDLRAAIVTDLQALERRALQLADPYVADH